VNSFSFAYFIPSHLWTVARVVALQRGALLGLAGESMQAVIKRLSPRASRVGVKSRLVLLDRGFCGVGVVRYLQAARYPFLVPVAHRRCPPRDTNRGTRRLVRWKDSSWSTHMLHDIGRLRKANV